MNRLKNTLLKPASLMLKRYLDTLDPKLTRAFTSWAIRNPTYELLFDITSRTRISTEFVMEIVRTA